MNLASIKNVVVNKTALTMLKGRKVSPHVLVGVGVIGVVTTAVLASKATLKLDETVEEISNFKSVNDSVWKDQKSLGTQNQLERTKDVTHFYIWSTGKILRLYSSAIISGGVTVACIIGSHRIMNSRNIALAAAYKTLDEMYNSYREETTREIGPEKDREIIEATSKRSLESPNDKIQNQDYALKRAGFSTYARYFDEYSRFWQKDAEHNMMFVKVQQNYLNDKLIAKGYVFLNDAYEALGIPRSKAGQIVGWVYDGENGGDSFIDFGIFRSDGKTNAFVNGEERSILLDFNVDGPILDLI